MSSSFDRSLKLWEIPEGIVQVSHDARILSVAFSRSGKFVATGARDKLLKIWDSNTGEELNTCQGHNRFVFALSSSLALFCLRIYFFFVLMLYLAIFSECVGPPTNNTSARRVEIPLSEFGENKIDDATLHTLA